MEGFCSVFEVYEENSFVGGKKKKYFNEEGDRVETH